MLNGKYPIGRITLSPAASTKITELFSYKNGVNNSSSNDRLSVVCHGQAGVSGVYIMGLIFAVGLASRVIHYQDLENLVRNWPCFLGFWLCCTSVANLMCCYLVHPKNPHEAWLCSQRA